jgi:hypothetical protein
MPPKCKDPSHHCQPAVSDDEPFDEAKECELIEYQQWRAREDEEDYLIDFLLNDSGPLFDRWGNPVSEDRLKQLTPDLIRELGIYRVDA